MGTGQRSSDDEVSKLIFLDREGEFFWETKCLNGLTFSLKSVYIVFVERLFICLVIVAMVETCNPYRSYFTCFCTNATNEEFGEQ